MKKQETTLRCVTVLAVIAVTCAVLLAVLNPLLYVAPSVASISDNVTAKDLGLSGETALEWIKTEVDAERAEGKGGSVIMAAECVAGENKFVGLYVKTKAAAKLGETTYSMYFDVKNDKLVKAVIVEDGATSGRTFEFALKNDKLSNVKPIDSYYKIIDKPSKDVYGEFDKPKCGATYTVTAVDNAFRIAADYYYYVYGKGANK